MPRRVPEEDDDGKGSTEYHANLVALAPSGKEIARLEDGGLIELERQLLETLLAKTKRDRRIAQLTDELVLKGALLEQVRADAAEAKKRAGLELRTLQAKVDELLLSRDQALEQAQSALQEATFRALLEQAEASAAAGKKPAGLEKRELQAKFDELLPAKSKAEADTSRVGTEAAAGAVNMDVDRVMTRLMERVRAVEAEMASLRGKGKSINYRLLLFITLVFIVLLVFVPFPCLFVSD
jgi:HSP90 family molecular chaperone